MTTKRRRLSAEDARAAILDTAEAQLRARGPDGIRLQDIADELGISHPAILHHFGNRTGLVRAVVQRSLDRLERDIMTAVTATDVDASAAEALMARVFAVMRDEGNARVLAWLSLSGSPATARLDHGEKLRAIAAAVHARRPPGAAFEDTLFTVLLAAMAVFGDSIAGDRLREGAGLGDDPTARDRFLAWLTRLLLDRVG